VQRRALRFTRDMQSGATVSLEDVIALRPCPTDGIDPFDIEDVVGRKLVHGVSRDQLIRKSDFEGN